MPQSPKSPAPPSPRFSHEFERELKQLRNEKRDAVRAGNYPEANRLKALIEEKKQAEQASQRERWTNAYNKESEKTDEAINHEYYVIEDKYTQLAEDLTEQREQGIADLEATHRRQRKDTGAKETARLEAIRPKPTAEMSALKHRESKLAATGDYDLAEETRQRYVQLELKLQEVHREKHAALVRDSATPTLRQLKVQQQAEHTVLERKYQRLESKLERDKEEELRLWRNRRAAMRATITQRVNAKKLESAGLALVVAAKLKSKLPFRSPSSSPRSSENGKSGGGKSKESGREGKPPRSPRTGGKRGEISDEGGNASDGAGENGDAYIDEVFEDDDDDDNDNDSELQSLSTYQTSSLDPRDAQLLSDLTAAAEAQDSEEVRQSILSIIATTYANSEAGREADDAWLQADTRESSQRGAVRPPRRGPPVRPGSARPATANRQGKGGHRTRAARPQSAGGGVKSRHYPDPYASPTSPSNMESNDEPTRSSTPTSSVMSARSATKRTSSSSSRARMQSGGLPRSPMKRGENIGGGVAYTRPQSLGDFYEPVPARSAMHDGVRKVGQKKLRRMAARSGGNGTSAKASTTRRSAKAAAR